MCARESESERDRERARAMRVSHHLPNPFPFPFPLSLFLPPFPLPFWIFVLPPFCQALMSPDAQNGGHAFLETLLSGCLGNETAILVGDCEAQDHGVTFNEVSKLFAMGFSYSGNSSHLKASTGAYDMLQRYDMQPHGVNSADEDLNGISPSAATETCDISDFLYSNSWLLRVTGDGAYGDHMERAFHNAAPAAVNRSFQGHVYFQSPNFAYNLSQRNYPYNPGQDTTRWSNEYYHDPPCCTGNQARMLPNYIHHMWFGTHDGGLAAALYGPNQVKATVGSGAKVSITTTTRYPFTPTLNLSIAIFPSGEMAEKEKEMEKEKAKRAASAGSAAKVEEAQFPLLLRIPGWCNKSSMVVSINGGPSIRTLTTDPKLTSFVRLDRMWADGDVVTVTFLMEIVAKKGVTINSGWTQQSVQKSDDRPANDNNRHNHHHPAKQGQEQHDAQQQQQRMLGGGHMTTTGNLPYCTVERGPLLFALPLEHNGGYSSFKYALDCDAASMSIKLLNHSPAPFDWPLQGAPVTIAAKAATIEWWDNIGLLPNASVSSSNHGGVETLNLVPYGCTQMYRLSMYENGAIVFFFHPNILLLYLGLKDVDGGAPHLTHGQGGDGVGGWCRNPDHVSFRVVITLLFFVFADMRNHDDVIHRRFPFLDNK